MTLAKWAVQRFPSKRRLWRRAILAGLLLGGLATLGASLAVRSAARGRTFADTASIEHRPVGLVLGCSPVLADGRANLFFRHRVEAAATLFHAGKVDRLIVSGDNHRKGYDEPTDLKNALVAAGVPAERIHCDYAGFRTLDSVVRVRRVFGQERITVVSQRFHNQRAIFLAAHHGVDAIGFDAAAVPARSALRTRAREALARVKTLMDVYVLRTGPRFLGPPVSLEG